MNSSRDDLSRIVDLLPALSSPTVSQLQDSDMISIATVIDTRDRWELIRQAREVGATGLLCMPLTAVIP